MPDLSMYPTALQDLIHSLRELPGIGARTAERLALAILDWPEERRQTMANQLCELRNRVHYCTVCGNFADRDTCRICASPARRADLVCVVEQPSQIGAIERSGCYDGRYHVLGGRLAPLDGVGPESLRIPQLEQRLRQDDIREVILATGSDVEGEATASYLAERIREFGVEVSRIAAGIPVGADLSYADNATMATALGGRRPVS